MSWGTWLKQSQVPDQRTFEFWFLTSVGKPVTTARFSSMRDKIRFKLPGGKVTISRPYYLEIEQNQKRSWRLFKQKAERGYWVLSIRAIGMRWGCSIGRDLCLTEQGWGEGGILRPSLFPLLPPRDPCYTNPLHATLRLRPIHSLVFTLTPPRPESSSACNPFASMVCLINRSWTESQIPLKLNLEVPTLLLRFIGFVTSVVESFTWTWD